MSETTVTSRDAPEVPRGFVGYLRGMGPGIVMGMAAVGAGDLVDSSVSGANYGYALMWALAIALISRYFITSALAKYQLCNSRGDETILHGYARMWRGFPILLGVASAALVFVINSYQIRGSGTALFNLLGRSGGETWGIFLWSMVAAGVSVAIAFGIFGERQYKVLEWLGLVAVVCLVTPFIVAAIFSGPDLSEILRGLAFDIPPDEGAIGSVFVTLALMANFGGSVANLLYTYFMGEKGWHTPAYRKLQLWDLVSGIAAILVVNLAIWVVAAETLFASGRTIEGENDLAALMVSILGPVGATLFWVGLLAATFDGIGSLSFGSTKMLLGAVHQTLPARATRHGGSTERDPLFKWIQIGILITVPLIFALPIAPNFVILTIMANALGVLLLPAISVGALWLTSQSRLMLPGYANRWWENVALVILTGVNLWGTYLLLKNLYDLVSGLL